MTTFDIYLMKMFILRYYKYIAFISDLLTIKQSKTEIEIHTVWLAIFVRKTNYYNQKLR